VIVAYFFVGHPEISHLPLVVPTTILASLPGHRRHGCYRRSRLSFRPAGLLRLDAEESVEESLAEFSSAGEIHEKVDGVVGAHENLRHGVDEISYSLLFRRVFQKCSVGVSEEVDFSRQIAHEEHDADDDQHHCG